MPQNWIIPLTTALATLPVAGGKGMNLARLARAGFPVPGGFIVTTSAYQRIVTINRLAPAIAAALADIDPAHPATLEAAATTLRDVFNGVAIPAPLVAALEEAYQALGDDIPVAVRSSATAEDLPSLSFAGQQETYLNVIGYAALLDAIRACWGSLWTARAIGYRARNDIAPNAVALAVVVQTMVESEASGVLFTANPHNGRRTEMVIDATIGLGEALVAGQVEPDHYVVDTRSGEVKEKHLGAKATIIRGWQGGGTRTITGNHETRPALPEVALSQLLDLGRSVACELGSPQDIEWAWSNKEFFLLQSRPITTLFPLPAGVTPPPQQPLRVFLSFGAVQGMLDPLTPLGQDTIRGFFAGVASLFGYTLSAETQNILLVAAERLFINITTVLRHPLGRRVLAGFLPVAEPATAALLATITEDSRLAPGSGRIRLRTFYYLLRTFVPMVRRALAFMRQPDTERERLDRDIERLIADLQTRADAAATFEARLQLFAEFRASSFTRLLTHMLPAVAAGMIPFVLLRRLADATPDAADPLTVTRGLPHNVTTTMDLALWRTAQRIREDPAATEALRATDADDLTSAFLAERLPSRAQVALADFLDAYGMRGLGEIDLGRPRWRENPTPLLRTLKSYLSITDETQAPDAIFARNAAAAEASGNSLLAALRHSPAGRLRALLARAAMRRMRALMGLRESPKFLIIRLMGIVRQVLRDSGSELVAAGVLQEADDLFFLHLDELRALAHGVRQDWQALVSQRRAAYAAEQRRVQIPRLLLSDGETLYESAPQSMPDGSGGELVGSPVSPGVVEGHVRVLFDPSGAQLLPGEILVCPGTDPAWTPLFLSAGGLITEVGGLMTHGSVVAREYGIPAVVGVRQATRELHTGQRIRLDGTSGRIQFLDHRQR